MGKYNFLQPYLWLKVQNFLKPSTLFSLIKSSSLLQAATIISSGSLVKPAHPSFTQILATYYDRSKQYNLRKFSLTTVQIVLKLP